ncbi:hypothetical protein LIT25_11330 [Bacillus sp. F19]|nr:hypothetical protein LIT25_11330 [Bacillus sp. F19]
MGIQFKIEMVDVLNGPLASDAALTIEREDSSGVHSHTIHTSQTYVMPAPPPDTKRLTITVEHPDYVTQRVTVTLGTVPYYWDNRGCELIMTPTSADLKVIMGRVQQAPITAPPYNDKTKGDKPGVFYRGGVSGSKYYAILGPLLNQTTTVRTLEDAPISGGLPRRRRIGNFSMLKTAAANGWDRFNTTDLPVRLDANGGFLWLEYGSVTGKRLKEPRFLIAVLAPALTGAIPFDGLDYIVYFSPSTANGEYPRSPFPFRVNYPYTVFPENTMRQPYVNLAYRHLFENAVLAQASIASKKPAIIVMPIFPAVPDIESRQMWQPFNSQEGIHRLLLEITQFLHGFGYATGSDFSRWQGASAPENQLPVVTRPPASSAVNQPRPKIRNVTVAGFSNSIKGVFSLIGKPELVDKVKYPPALFGVPGALPTKQFADVWREIWDLDFELNEKGTGIKRNTLEKSLIAWLNAGISNRRLRMYHSGYTTDNVRPAILFPALAALPKTVIAPPAVGNAWAEEWRDPSGRWSLAFFSTAYLQANTRPPDIQPKMPLLTEKFSKDAVHPFSSSIGFGHAAKLRLT